MSTTSADHPFFVLNIENPSQYFESATKRLETFSNTQWTSFLPWITEDRSIDFANAGLYYIGYQDCVKCFICNGGLCNWEVADDPWVEHAKYYPNCTHINLTRSNKFINICRELGQIEKSNKKLIEDYNTLSFKVRMLSLIHGNEYEVESNPYVCKICFTKDMDTILTPCNHLLSCHNCSYNLKICPI